MAEKIQGLDAWKVKLSRLPTAVTNRLRAANKQSVQDIAAAVKPHVPVMGGAHKGRTPGALRDSVGWCEGTPAGFKAATTDRSQATTAYGLRFSVFAGGGKAFYAVPVEGGRKGQGRRQIKQARFQAARGDAASYHRAVSAAPPHPYFWPIVRVYKNRIRNRQNKAFRDGLKDVGE